MRPKRTLANLAPWVALVCFAALMAAWLYGPNVLQPSSHAWLLHGDPAQHYVGSAFFLAEPWRWPPGAIHGFGQAPTSVVFVDAIPGVALAAKLLGVSAGQQYFGLWMLLCHVLSAWFGARLLRTLGVAGWPLCAGGLLFALAPAMLLRVYGHEALMAHFLVIAALQLALMPWRWGPWLALGLCSVLVHPYLALMTGVLGAGAAVAALALRELTVRQLAAQAVASLVLCGSLAWAAGYFIGGGSQVSSGGHGFFSANLLTWVDPMHWQGFLAQHGRDVARGREWSVLLPAQAQATAGQYEGFAYLGAGVLILVVLAVVPARRPAQAAPAGPAPAIPLARWSCVVSACTALALLALSAQPSVGGTVLLSLPLSDGVASALGVFRASGRFVWPATYLVMAVAISRTVRLPAGGWLLAVCLLVQAVDLSAKLSELRHRFRDGPEGAVAAVTAPLWAQALARCPRLELVATGELGSRWIAPALAAGIAGAQVVPAPVARPSPDGARQRQAQVNALLAGNGWRNDTVYVVWPELAGAIQALPAGARRVAVEGYDLVLPGPCQSA
jgi:hypothetical protein